jgi:YHS domain-containing protein
MKRVIFKALSLGLASVVMNIAYASPQVFEDKNGAIRGYDPVAYHLKHQPVKGKKTFTTQWHGATWRFANAENLALFQADPEKYAPQYGGYCAYGVAQDHKPEIDPNAFKVVDGKLYLNLSQHVLQKWQADIPNYVKDADKNWVDLSKQ